MKILAIGNALVDVLTELETDDMLQKLALPKGSMQLIDSEKLETVTHFIKEVSSTMVPGGSATNTITSLAHLGIETKVIGKIGRDELGEFYEQDLKNRGVLPCLLRGDLPSGRATTFISADGERTFATYLGAAASLQAQELSTDMFASYDLLHIEGFLVQSHELIETAMRLAKENHCKVSMDLASYNVVKEDLEFVMYLLKEYVDIVFANEEEAKAFSGKEPEEALRQLAAITEVAIVKTGAKGSLVMAGEHKWEIPSMKADKVDTTGAGDNYAAGFLYGLVKGYPLDICGRLGTLLAAHVIEVIGTKLPISTWMIIKNEIKDIVAEIE